MRAHPWAEIDLGDTIFCFRLASPLAPFRFSQHAPGGDFWSAALSLDRLSQPDLRALLYTACPEISAREVRRLMLPANKQAVIAALREAVEIAVSKLESSQYVN